MNITELLNALNVDADSDFLDCFARQDNEIYMLGNISIDTLEHNGVNAVLINVTDDEDINMCMATASLIGIRNGLSDSVNFVPNNSPVYIWFSTGEREEVQSVTFQNNEVFLNI